LFQTKGEEAALNTNKKKIVGSMPIPLAGNPIDWVGSGYLSSDSILSHAKDSLLPFFTTRNARVLRAVCTVFKEAVTEHKWRDEVTVIRSRVGSWRASFPAAEAANVEYTKVKDEDFWHLRGLRSLNMCHCKSVTDAAFVNLRGSDTQ